MFITTDTDITIFQEHAHELLKGSQYVTLFRYLSSNSHAAHLAIIEVASAAVKNELVRFCSIYNKYIANDDDNAAESAAMDIDNCKYYSPDQFTELSQDNNDTMSIFCVNCQSINAHWDGLSDLLCELNSESHKFDFIGLTEIFKIHEHTNYTIEGYHPILYKCRPESEIKPRGCCPLYK